MRERTCVVCNGGYTPTGTNQKLCSERCRHIRKIQVARKHYGGNRQLISMQRKVRRDIRRPTKSCAYCGKTLGSKRVKVCGDSSCIKARDNETRRKRTLRKYNLTPESYAEILAKQHGGCAVCGAENSGDGWIRSLVVDHDHSCCPDKNYSCGKCVRGLLCHNCNVTLGLVGDNAERLRALAAYLERI